MKRGAFLTIFLIGVGFVFAEPEETVERNGKVFPIFQVVRFPNTVCVGTTQNGTCYTAEECSSKGGANDGSCASGFGVCCKFEEACGSSKSENNTILTQTAVTTLASPCTYMVCPCSSNICRIRYDFESMTLAGAVTGTTLSPQTLGTNTNSMGACVEDKFSITGVGGMGSPVICGTNTGYHMVIDQTQGSTDCQKAMFNIGGDTTISRSWTIKVTQYACGDEDNGGPTGCLQWFTGTSGVVASYGWVKGSTATTSTTTHLQSLHYSNCFRREKGKCLICFVPTIVAATPQTATQSDSFGISISPGSPAGAAHNAVGTQCTLDYIEIPNAVTLTIASATTVIGGASRLCGRHLNVATTTTTTSVSTCTRTYPFRLGVHFDETELSDGSTAYTALTSESDEFPGGILGFSLNFEQKDC